MSVEERTLVRALASQSGRAPGVYPGHRLYLLTGLLTRLIGTEKTERDAEDGHRAIPQVSETRRDVGDAQEHVVWLITQRSQVQILPPLPTRSEARSTRSGPLSWALVKRICKRRAAAQVNLGGSTV